MQSLLGGSAFQRPRALIKASAGLGGDGESGSAARRARVPGGPGAASQEAVTGSLAKCIFDLFMCFRGWGSQCQLAVPHPIQR